jgi:hypothetical protein
MMVVWQSGGNGRAKSNCACGRFEQARHWRGVASADHPAGLPLQLELLIGRGLLSTKTQSEDALANRGPPASSFLKYRL